MLGKGLLWPEPLIQLNPSFERGDTIDDLVREGILHSECAKVFRIKPEPHDKGTVLKPHKHQSDAVRIAKTGRNYVLTTGTGSGKSLAYIIPIVNHVLENGSGKGIQAIIVYPMNALANSQFGELKKFLNYGYPDGRGPVTFRRYTGQEKDEQRKEIIANPPDIILTNYVMLELILTRPEEAGLVKAAQNLRFLVLDELHTYRGRQGSDVGMLVRRVREILNARYLQCVGTSATIVRKGTLHDQQKEVARVASSLFGDEVTPEDVIMETLRRSTDAPALEDPAYVDALKQRITNPTEKVPKTYEEFKRDPLSSWIETTFGLATEEQSGRLIRRDPIMISGDEGGASQLAKLTGLSAEVCERAIQHGLLGGAIANPDTGFPAFAFRLHQFISRGDTAYASLETEDIRYFTTSGQQYVPDSDRKKILLPVVFCRECGQEYYAVRQMKDRVGKRTYKARDAYEKALKNEEHQDGFLYINSENPWPHEFENSIQQLPDDWVEIFNGVPRIRRDRKEDLPYPVRINTLGEQDDSGLELHFIKAPFRFCLNCGVSYGFRQSSDFGKLASLASEGRSTATTVLSLNSILLLRKEATLHQRAKKLLSFTDNRQDASLQAGHFNDFVEIGLLRSALYKSVAKAGATGITHEELTQKVFDCLELPFTEYASVPDAKFAARSETEKALRQVLGYRLYRDQRRGWRVTAPNLEQSGLLEIDYLSLRDLCESQEEWQNLHPALSSADPETRFQICKVLLDFMRRELAIKVDYLDARYQEGIQQMSSQRLIPPWGIDENETPIHASVLFPRSTIPNDYGGNVYLSARGGFGMFLRRPNLFPNHDQKLNLEETGDVIKSVIKALQTGGMIQEVMAPTPQSVVPGYQLLASAMIWKAGDGTRPFHDPIRVPRASLTGGVTNPYFVNLYKTIAGVAHGIHAREHTAQVQEQVRQDRELAFGEGRLPILYCSPTMELGVDIKELNVVNMRNIPPTSANYAQRSGRAGRGGDPALVFSYCSTGSPHDQYFFKRPSRMVSGAVSPPQLDLTNEDLIRAHIHAIWIAEAGLKLGKSLKQIIDVSGENPTLALLPDIQADLRAERPRERARTRAQNVLRTIEDELSKSDWYTDRWLDDVFAQLERRFEQACERWRELFRAAKKQAKGQGDIVQDPSRSAEDKKQAARLRREAESQLDLLTEAENIVQSDFYSYRYFAGEGFLPGYNFPRLPLSAFVPGRMGRQHDEFLSRPRFIAISEFGPKATVYHEGSRYEINKVMLPIALDQEPFTERAKQCSTCGYLHNITSGEGPDLCERCEAQLPHPITPLLRLQNVSTKRRERINSDEEERLRLGYEIRTGYRFAEMSGSVAARNARLKDKDGDVAQLTYGPSATLWRINLGWARREDKGVKGFVLDLERGYWGKSSDIEEDPDDPISNKKKRVIPYVEDHRNCLIFAPKIPLSLEQMASLESALKNAIQVEYHLEDSELASEALPTRDERRLILFYEASEGGAGVLRRLIDDQDGFRRVCEQALDICHFDPNGHDRRHAEKSNETCEAACYDCLLTYRNQRDHEILDRQTVKDVLLRMAKSQLETAPVDKSRTEHLKALFNLCGSDLERSFLQFLEKHKLKLPSKAQSLIETCQTRPDFLYEKELAAIYIDGPHHEYLHRHDRDLQLTERMHDYGYSVIRFTHLDDWLEKIAKYPSVFGKLES